MLLKQCEKGVAMSLLKPLIVEPSAREMIHQNKSWRKYANRKRITHLNEKK